MEGNFTDYLRKFEVSSSKIFKILCKECIGNQVFSFKNTKELKTSKLRGFYTEASCQSIKFNCVDLAEVSQGGTTAIIVRISNLLTLLYTKNFIKIMTFE